MNLVDRIATRAQQAVAPYGAAGASDPVGSDCAERAVATPCIATLSLAAAHATPSLASLDVPPSVSAALEAVLAAPEGASAMEGAMAVLAALSDPTVTGSNGESVLFPCSSSSDTTPSADMACALSSSVPDMQGNSVSEFQFEIDHFESEADDNSPRSSMKSDRSENSATSAQSDRRKSNQNDNSNRSVTKSCGFVRNSGWNNSFRSRGFKSKTAEAPPPSPSPSPLKRHGSLKKDFKSSASLEQVSYKSLISSNKKADKKKGKKNRRESTPPRVIDPAVRAYNLTFFMEVTTTTEDMLFNVQLSLSDIINKGSYTVREYNDCRIMMNMLINLMDEITRWTRMAHTALRVDTETPMWTLDHASLQSRRDTCFSQALTTCTAGLMCWLSSVPREVVAKIIQSGLGPLCGFEGLLSLYALEKTMWGDMVVAVEDLHTVIFKLVKVTSSMPTIPQVTGHRNGLVVELPVSEALYGRFDNCENKKPTFNVTAVFFNIGINEKASVAEALNECKPQHYSNSDNLLRLNKYYHKYCKLFPSDPMEPLRASSRSKPLEEVMENLHTAVQKRAPKNVEVLQLAALATRQMHGVRFTSCKSAKDRTGMSVTLEQVTILSSEYHLADHERKRALDIMRSEGCRRENTLKNIGMSKYAFSKKQVQSLPEDYRPPQGSYGTIPT